jgi:hypothetical protein
MRRVASLAVGCLLLSLAPGARAESIGRASNVVKKGQWAMSLATELLFGRQLHNGAEARMYGGGHGRGYGLTDWLSVYGLLGAAHLSVDDPTIVRPSDPSSSTHSYGAGLLTSAQARAKVLELKTWEVGASVRYVDMRAGGKGKNAARWHHWLMAGTLAKPIGRATPYAGGAWSMLSVNYKVREDGNIIVQDRYREDLPVGAFVGLDVSFGEGEDVVLNVEALYLDGPELSTSIAYVF